MEKLFRVRWQLTKKGVLFRKFFNMKIGFIGIGKLGKDAAEVMYESGHDVIGYDVKIVSNAKFPITNSIKK